MRTRGAGDEGIAPDEPQSWRRGVTRCGYPVTVGSPNSAFARSRARTSASTSLSSL